MNSQVTNLSYSVFSNKGIFAILLGSGVSAPAGIPTAWDICLDLIRQIAILDKSAVGPNLETWYREKFKEDIDYSNLLEKLTSTPEERINVLKPYFEPNKEEADETTKKPTIAHRRIADLVQLGYIKVIITTNFDRLVENALKDVGIEPVVISNPNHVENVVPLIHSNVTVIKIHGDYLDTKFLNVKSELSGYDSRLSGLLSFIFENFGLITCGWSAKWDAALVDLLKSSNKFRYSNFFFHKAQPTTELVELVNRRRGQLVEIKDANEVFTQIVENVTALAQHQLGDPLTPRLVVARVKKYLAKEEFLIPLSDIVHMAVEDVYEKLNNIPRVSIKEEDVRAVFKSVVETTVEFSPIFLQGGYWSKEHHLKIWNNAIKRIGRPTPRDSSYAIWDNIATWPVLIIRYVYGIGCVTNENWTALKSSFEIGLSDRYGKNVESLLQKTHPWRVIDRTKLNGLLNQRYIMPTNEHLFLITRSVFKDAIPDDIDFTNMFDYYEYICCLWYIQELPQDYPPIGRFGVRKSHFLDSKIKDFGLKGNEFELIKGGLFGDIQKLTAVMQKVTEILATERFY